jgi:hypothetical protein
MTSTDSGAPRPGRVAGIALLGLAAIALVIGLITVFGGNGDGRADGGNGDDQPTTTSSRPGTSGNPGTSGTSGQSTTRPPSSTSSSVSPPPGTSTVPPGSSPGQTPPPGGDGNGEPAKSVPVRVLNNSTIKGLAKNAASDLRADGWNVTETGNYSAGNIPTTTVYFRPGTDEEAAARAIGEAFGMRVEPRFEGIQDADPGVIVIVTNDYGKPAGSDGDKNEG